MTFKSQWILFLSAMVLSFQIHALDRVDIDTLDEDRGGKDLRPARVRAMAEANLNNPAFIAAQRAQAIVTIQLEIDRIKLLEKEVKSFGVQELRERFSNQHSTDVKTLRASALDEIRSLKVSLSETLANMKNGNIKNPTAYFRYQMPIQEFGRPLYFNKGARLGLAVTLAGLAGLVHAKEEAQMQTTATNLDSHRASRFIAPAAAGK